MTEYGYVRVSTVLQLLSYVAETEQQFIHQRQAEGIQAAKERGVQFGRSPLPKPPEFEELRLKWLDNKDILKRSSKGIKYFTRYIPELDTHEKGMVFFN